MIAPLAFAAEDFVPPDHAGFALSLFFGVGLLGIVVGALVIWMLVMARSLSKAHAREEKEMLDLAARPLSAGPHRVVCGRVELDEGSDVAIQIDIDQKVHDHSSKNGKWHTWDESDRSTKRAPFYIVRDDGETIYVEPPRDLLVVDSLETKYPIDAPRRRIRVSDVRRGERFFVYGDLDRGAHPRARGAYRDGSGWIMRSPRQRMLLATDAIRGRYKERIAYLYLVGGIWAAIFVLAHAFVTAPFLKAALFGTRTTGTVIDHRTWVTTNKGQSTTHYGLTVQTADGLILSQEVERPLFDAVSPAKPGDVEAATIPVLEAGRSERTSYLGYEPNLPGFWIFIGALVSIVAIILTVSGYRSRVPWYDRQKLDEHGGEGSWVEPRPHNPV
jgi:hypothetical protein